MNFYANKALCAPGCRRLADSDQQSRTRKASKLLLCMKLTAFIMLFTCLQTSATGVAQQTITFSGKEVSLENVFAAIKKQTNYKFFFNIESIHHARAVTIEVKNASIEQVLNVALKDQPFTYTIKGRTVFIIQKKEEEKSSSSLNAVNGDPVTVTGRVVDDQGQPLVGANVKIKGTSIGVTTDKDGLFKLTNVEPDATLEISFVGHETQVIPVRGKSFFAVNLAQKLSLLDEMQVIAYGTTTKRFNTGNVTSVKASDIEKQPVNNPLLALEGRVPGLAITQQTGLAGGGVTVRIQGQNSITAGNDPLYVIDGVPFISQLPMTGIDFIVWGASGTYGNLGAAGNPLNYLNPNDIESIDVLKDADATAIYGSRAANGAILITTKKGSAGKVKINFDVQQGTGKVTRTLKMLNTSQYIAMRNEALKNDGLTPNPNKDYDLTLWDTTRNTDWEKALIGKTAQYTNFNGAISGGNSEVQYLIGATYHKETTVFPFTKDFADQKGSMHFNINNRSLDGKFRLQFSGSFMVDNNKLPSSDLTKRAVQLEPDAPSLYNEDGSLNWAPTLSGRSSWTNPIATYMYSYYQNKTTNLISNLVLGYKILPSLEISSSFGYTNMQTDDYSPVPSISIKPENQPFVQSSAVYGNRNIHSWSIEPQVNYKRRIFKGELNILVGSTILENNSKGGYFFGSGYSSDALLENIQASSNLRANYAFVTQYKYNAAFGRFLYNWRDKYILNISARRDGSSRFGSANQFHNFGALGGAWLFSEERFIRQGLPFLSFGKIRASYGTTGNDQIADYQFMSLYNLNYADIPYQGAAGLSVSSLPNPHLQWEETKKFQIGLEIGVLHDRVLFTTSYSKNKSSNELLSYQLPSITGFNGFMKNFPATIVNTDWEFSFNSINIKGKDFSWSSNINLTIPRNKVTKFPNINLTSYASGNSGVVIGQPLGVIKAFHYLGVDATTGNYQFSDSHGSPTSSPDFTKDANVFINTLPHYYGGIQNSLTYKGFQIDFLFQFVKQTGVDMRFYNTSSITPGAFFPTASNQPSTMVDRWHKPGDVASIQKVSSLRYNSLWFGIYNAVSSDANFSDASYIRLKNVSISYQLPQKIIKNVHLSKCRIYIQGQNLLTITNYQGMDPENQTISFLPPLKLVIIGVQVGL